MLNPIKYPYIGRFVFSITSIHTLAEPHVNISLLQTSPRLFIPARYIQSEPCIQVEKYWNEGISDQ